MYRNQENNFLSMLFDFVSQLNDDKVYNDTINKINDTVDQYMPKVVQDVWIEVLSMVELMKDRRRNKKEKLMVVAALLYLICPVDVIPDNIPFVGYADDVFVIKYVAEQLNEQLKPYRIKVQRDILRKQKKNIKQNHNYGGPRKQSCCDNCIIL
eukprot:685925_1